MWEDQLSLHGFALPEELELFEFLILVSGVGSKRALSILSITSAPALLYENFMIRFLLNIPSCVIYHYPQTSDRQYRHASKHWELVYF